jgi:hypothetical protein
MQQKAALVGAREGQWIRTAGMRRLQVNARVHREARVRIEQTMAHEGAVAHEVSFMGARIEPLREAPWTRVCIIDGPHEDSIVLLQGH